MIDVATTALAAEILHREGFHLDRQDWKAWLDLYREDAEFWMPAWKGEHEPTEDPRREVSLIYHDSRAGLEERIMRIGTRKSVTAMPLPRTVHFASNVLVLGAETDAVEAAASWTVHVYDPRAARQAVHVGRYEYRLRRDGDGAWRFARKKIILVNDRLPTALDFYCV